MTELPPQPEELSERQRELEERLAERRRELEEKLAEELEHRLAEERRTLEDQLKFELDEELKARQSKEPLAPCPECGGQRIILYCDPGSGYSLTIPITGAMFLSQGVLLDACPCLNCGHTTLRVRPNDMEKLRKEAELERQRKEEAEEHYRRARGLG